MNEIVKIGNRDIPVIEWKGQRVITTSLLADVYEATDTQIKQNFNNNEKHFEEGKHYFLLKGEDLKEFKRVVENFDLPFMEALKFTSRLYLWTRRGASRHSKMLGTDKAWEQFDELEESYYNPERKMPQIPQDYPSALRAYADEYEKNMLLEQKNDTLNKENDLLSQKTLEWADRPIINALVRAYGHYLGDYAEGWRDFKKELLYQYGINLNSRKTSHLNNGGSKKKGTLDFINDDELTQAISTAVALCREHDIDISDIIQKKSKLEVA